MDAHTISLEGNPQIELIRGWAHFERPGRIVVDSRALEGARVIVASGVQPHIPAIPGLDEVPYLTNETVMDLEKLPGRLIVLGGGAEGLEFGQAFHRFGSRVTIVQRNPRLAPKEDPEISQAIEEALRDEGLEILTGTAPQRICRPPRPWLGRTARPRAAGGSPSAAAPNVRPETRRGRACPPRERADAPPAWGANRSNVVRRSTRVGVCARR